MCVVIPQQGLEKFFTEGITFGIQHQHRQKLRLILGMLDAAVSIQDMDASGLRLHKLTGKRKNDYAVTVNGNWRITFQFRNGDAYIIYLTLFLTNQHEHTTTLI